MRTIKNLPSGLEYRYTNVYGASVYFSPRSKRYYEAYEDCILSFSWQEFGTIR